MLARPAPALAIVAALVAGAGFEGCGDNEPIPAGASELNSLQVLSPPGESIGLPFHGVETLRVQYIDPRGKPIAAAPVSFQLVTSASEATGGSTVSATSVATNEGGIASVELVAGAERVNFRVRAVARDAPPAFFFIAVSDEGFVVLVATPEHAGFRAPEDFGSIELRRYRTGELRCADLDIDSPPESVFPPLSLDGFGDRVAFRNVTAGEPYTIIGWGAFEPAGARLAAGCVELGADHVRAGSEIRFPLPVADRIPTLPSAMALASSFDTTPLAHAVAAAGPDVWPVLDCPLGRAQLLIDCALDAQAPDGALDCVVDGASVLVSEVQAARGPAGGAGCRPAQAAGGDSLDQILEATLGPPWPDGSALDALLEARRAPLRSFRLTSRLESAGAGAVTHRLERITIIAGGDRAELDLVASDRPVVRQVAAAAMDPVAGLLAVGRHSFTVDYGRFARDAFVALGLAPAGLDDEASALGSALYRSVASDGRRGCAALSRVVCIEIGRPGNCLEAVCSTAASQLDLLLDTWWQVLDGPGYDLTLTGSVPLRDVDGDMVMDRLRVGGSADDRGSWAGELGLESGEAASIAGSFAGDPADSQ